MTPELKAKIEVEAEKNADQKWSYPGARNDNAWQRHKEGYIAGALAHAGAVLPNDDEVKKWYEENIGYDPDNPCSASSGIYKFRQWLKERGLRENPPAGAATEREKLLVAGLTHIILGKLVYGNHYLIQAASECLKKYKAMPVSETSYPSAELERLNKDIAKMREALEKIASVMEKPTIYDPGQEIYEMCGIAEQALKTTTP